MPEFAPGKTVETARPVIEVTNGFAPGTYRFRLTVIDDAGNESSPAELTVTVAGKTPLRPVIPGRLRDRLGDVVRIDPKVIIDRLKPIKPKRPS